MRATRILAETEKIVSVTGWPQMTSEPTRTRRASHQANQRSLTTKAHLVVGTVAGNDSPALGSVLSDFNLRDRRTRKFWLLSAGGLVVFFVWLLLLSGLAGVWTANNGITAIMIKLSATLQPPIIPQKDLLYVDVWFALGLMAALDAFAIVLNFQRALIHQFHYFVSLRMMSLAFVISLLVYLQTIDTNTLWRMFQDNPAALAVLGLAIYAGSTIATQYLHKLLPSRGVSSSRGSLRDFSENMSLFDVPWPRAIIYAAINGAVGLALITIVPREWTMLNPVIHITWEVTFLGLMSSKQTPRYIWFATPVVQAATCVDWGLRQIIAAPAIVVRPWSFVALFLAGRVLLDIHLHTMFRNRSDFRWARSNVLFSTKSLVVASACMILFEYLGFKLLTYIKPITVFALHAFGVLVFLLPACYALAFDRIKSIRP